MNNKFIGAKLLSVLLCTAFLASCSYSNVQTNTAQPTTGTEVTSVSSDSINSSPVTSDMITYDADDVYTDWESQNPNYIELKGNSATFKGSGVTITDSKITISAAGVYVLTGNLDNGQIIVDEKSKETVRLVLNNVNINSADNSAIYVKSAGKTIISLPSGTQNTVSDGKKYSSTGENDPTSAIFSKDNLTINGTGKLSVSGNFKDGITSKDDLRITAGTININSTDDGLVGRDMILVKDGNITIQSGGDGIKSTNDSDVQKGFIALENGTFSITSGKDGIQAETSLLIKDGEYNITTGGGSANAVSKTNENMPRPGGMMNNNTAAKTTETTEAESESAKGIKATADITISGGKFTMDTSDDSIHSNNSINVAGGDISINAGDDGMHADSTLSISGGKINIAKSYEGIESAVVNISGGETHVVSKDDGVNIAGGNDNSALQGRPGQNSFNSTGNNKLNISGGYISVDSTGDGLDANGSIYMTGGTVVVYGPTANNNGALDYDGTFEVSGGFLVSAGSSGMAQAPSEQSTQYSIAMSFSQTRQAGTLAALKDSTGKTIATFAPNKQYQTIVITTPDLKKDASYTLYTGGTSTGSSSDGLYIDGQYMEGSKVVNFTITNSVTWLNESGVTTAKAAGAGQRTRTKPQ